MDAGDRGRPAAAGELDRLGCDLKRPVERPLGLQAGDEALKQPIEGAVVGPRADGDELDHGVGVDPVEGGDRENVLRDRYFPHRVVGPTHSGVDPGEVDPPRPAGVVVATAMGDRLLTGDQRLFDATELDERADPLRQQLVASWRHHPPLLVEKVDARLRGTLVAQGAGELVADAGVARPARVDAPQGLARDVDPLRRVARAVDPSVTGGEILHGAYGLGTATGGLAVREVDERDGLPEGHVPLRAVEDATLQVPVAYEDLDPREPSGAGQREGDGRDGIDAIVSIGGGRARELAHQFGQALVPGGSQFGLKVVDPLPDVHANARPL
ncbi:hypothetical protein OV090_12705 [Nannocystis sp. RBIL2]|uniref:hypothetical protein n=1 Tax=Nannocystis sp. RBIL2 TaxID=2996788 RepID=UPI00226E19E9|nr:hypothetical protein [Nannocystis sp. RBIL2]MCY1065633.1 hypothetical protein [Nannocystis sp. RBIL2]